MDANDWLEDLDAFLSEPIDDVEIEPPIDLDRVDRMLLARARLGRDRERIDAVAAKRHDDITEWHADRVSGIDRARQNIDQALEAFMRRYNQENPKIRSVSLPSGKLTLRKMGKTLVRVVDDAAFLAWAITRDDKDTLIKSTPKPVMAELAKLLSPAAALPVIEEDGHRYTRSTARVDDTIVPGVELRNQDDDNFGIE